MRNASPYITAFVGSHSSLGVRVGDNICGAKINSFDTKRFCKALFNNILNSSVSESLENCINAAI